MHNVSLNLKSHGHILLSMKLHPFPVNQSFFPSAMGKFNETALRCMAGFYTKLNVWGSLGLNFDYDGGPIIENGGPIFLYRRRILGGSKSFREGIRTGLSCQTGASKHQVIFASQPFVAT